MKGRLFNISNLMILMSFFLSACLKQPDSGTINIEKPIKTELPVMYSGSILKEGTKVVIHNKATLDSVFTAGQINNLTELQNIDFTKYDVLAGADTFTWGITELEHHLLQSANSIYIYKVYVHFDLTLQSGIFYYGIIIEKLPFGSHVIFDVDKLE
jgi:hypothetical protein